MNNLNYYLSLIPPQFKSKPKLNGWVTTLIQPFIDIANCANNMYLAFDIDLAVGVQLDTLGIIVGISRILPYSPVSGVSSVLDDSDYRFLLKAKIIQNYWDGKIITFENLWSNLLPNNPVRIIDNQNMTINVTVGGSLSVLVSEMINNGLIIPKPEGVGYNLSLGVATFGYDIETSAISGYDVGYWGI